MPVSLTDMSLRAWIDPESGLLGPAFPLPLDAPFDRRTALRHGVRDDHLQGLISGQYVRRVLQGVYAAAQLADSIRTRAEALMLVLPPDTVVIERTAGWLHGMPVLQRGAFVAAPSLEVGTTRDSRVRRGSVDGHRRLLSSEDVTQVHGIPVTTPLRTGMDLGRQLWRFDAIAAIDAALRLGVDHDQMLAEIDRFRGWRGVRQLRWIAPLGDPRAESPGESALRLHWIDALLPRPVPQYEILGPDGRLWFRLDLAAPEVRYAAEYDGSAHHTSASDQAYDRRRRGWMRDEEGWTVDVFDKDDVYRSRTMEHRLRDGISRARGAIARWAP